MTTSWPKRRAVGEREPHGRDRGLRVVGVHVDDRHVEALGEVGGVPRRAALPGIGREADLVVRDHVQRAAGPVALERVVVERLRDDALARRRPRRRGAGSASRRAGRAGRSRRSGRSAPRASQPSTTGLTASRWLGFAATVTPISPAAVVKTPCAPRWYLTSPVPPSASAATTSIERSPSNSRRIVLVRQADRVREHVEPPAVRHAEHDLLVPSADASSSDSSSIGISTSRPSSENCFWPRNARAQVALHRLDLAEARVERAAARRASSGVRKRRDSIALPQPDALLVVGDVLDLVGDRAAVRLLQARKRLGERLARDVDAEHGRGDARLELRRQPRQEAHRVERRVADRLGAQRVETCREMAVHAEGLDERHRGRDTAEQLAVRLGRRLVRRAPPALDGWRRRSPRRRSDRASRAVARGPAGT